MKHKTMKLVATAVVIVVVGALALRAMQARRAATAVPAAAPAPVAVDLAAGDLARAATQTLVRTVDLSGGLVAVNSAMVKARIAAEVREVAVREGEPVRAGQRIARLDDTEVAWRLRQARDQAASAKAQLDIAERTLANNQALVDQGFISRNALETSSSNVAAARATLQAAQAAAELAAKAVRDAEVTAPLSGQVSQRFVQPGERVGVDARLLEIVDLSKLELAAPLAPADAAAVRPGQAVRLTVEGVEAPVSGRVARVNPSTQAGTRAVQVYVSVESVAGLRQGLFARGTVELGSRPARVVPLSALRVDQARPYVLAAVDGKVVSQAVEPGARGLADFGRGLEAAVEVAALAEGTTVLRGSVGTLDAGTAVRLP
jgi:RND family efflux transporter MFP subunit